jgi:methionine-rich copper-binding protein CopC
MAALRFGKRPWEKFPITVDFANRLPAGVALNDVQVLASNGSQAAAVVSDPQALISDTIASVEVTGGEAGHTYRLDWQATCSDGRLVVGQVWMDVQEVLEDG